MSVKSVRLVICLCGIATAFGGPIIIRSGLHLGNQDSNIREEEGKSFGAHGKMQLANYEGDEGFNRADEKQFATAQDSGLFQVEGKDLLKHKDEADYQDKTYKQEDGESINDSGTKKGHKKGHQKTGFHNTYHKDESGSNSSYFDESLDAGDHYNRNSNKGIFADNAHRNQQGFHSADKENVNGNRRQGQYDNGGHYMKNQGGGADYRRKQYADNGKVHDNRAAGNSYGEGGRLVRDEIVQKTPYWNQPYVQQPVPAVPPPTHYPHYQQTPYDSRITIYEDPAYIRPNNYREYDRYYDRPRYYDERRPDNFDYYY